MTQKRVIFLPGASGDGSFWAPVAAQLDHPGEKILLDWPGLGNIPSHGEAKGFEDLVGLTLQWMDRPVDLVAQSMGGVVAVTAALERPESVRRLVLTATSGGLDMDQFKVQDWRKDYERQYPNAAPWITQLKVNYEDRIPSIQAPTLLLWSDADPISPLAVGEKLVRLFPRAELVVIAGGGHTFARDQADEVAPHIVRHLL